MAAFNPILIPAAARLPRLPEREGSPREEMRNQGSSATLIELALIIVLIAIVVMAILLIMGDDLRLWIVNTLQGLLPAR
jgi:Flp pilus assembly pilin Flp